MAIMLSALLTAVLAAPAEKEKGRFEYDPADATVPAALISNENTYDPHLVAADDRLWLTWLEFEPGKGDRIWVGSHDQRDWLSRAAITPDPGAYRNPTLSHDARGGGLWLTYEWQQGETWSVAALRLVPDGTAIRARSASDGSPRVPDGPAISDRSGSDGSPPTLDGAVIVGPGINHRTATARGGGLWVTWQTNRDGQFDVMAARVTDDGVEDAAVVGDTPSSSDWAPDIACTRDGDVHVVFDAYTTDGYDVLAQSRRNDQWDVGSLLRSPMTDGPAFEARARIAVNSKGRAWVAWEEGSENWGQGYVSRMRKLASDYLEMADECGPLHAFKRLHVGRLGKYRIEELTPTLPMPAFEKLTRRAGAPKGVERLGGFYERPEIAFDGLDRLWVVYRHYYLPWLGIRRASHVQEDWGIYARCYDGKGWSKLFRCSVGQGDGMQRLSIAPLKDGIALAYATGRTDRRATDTPHRIALARVTLAADAESSIFAKPVSKENGLAYKSRGRQQPDPPSAAYQLYFGDLHRHTDLSLCNVPTDGTLEDAYRYAIDVARLDFLGITDHSRDIAGGNVDSLLWWRCTKEVTRHTLAPRFIAMFAYEHSRGGEDHNVVSLKPVLWPDSMPFPQLWRLMDNDTFSIPHQTVCPPIPPNGEMPLGLDQKTWTYGDNDHRRLIEIYQGCRDRAIERDANVGLDKGHILGFIASSDHYSTSASFAGVWAPERTREAIFRAL
ncbi:MAG: hypothetical protein HY718_01945, partial [Planctomycetes bacterium]|nr:hypothetical protein [Planctomycetota bacterium]